MAFNTVWHNSLTTAAWLLAMVPAGLAAQNTPVARELSGAVTALQREASVPGVAIALVEEGQPAWSGTFGVANARTNAKVTNETVFEAASLSKPVFTYAVLRLAERGVIDLDTPLVRYTGRRYIEGDDRLDQITARHVLSNTTGFPNWRPRHGALEIFFTPGERFSYSGEGYAYLQEALEYTTGTPLETLMQELVFEPLGMASSSFIWRSMYEHRKATGHDEVGTAMLRREPPAADAASTLHTTALDYARFMAALLRHEGITPGAVEQMWSAQVTLDATCMVCTRQENLHPSPALSWGLGWGLEATGTDTTIWHWGDNGDMHAFVVAVPAERRAMVILTNGENGSTLLPQLSRIFLGRDHPAYAWLRVGPTSTPVRRLQLALVRRGPGALRDWARRRAALPVGEQITEREMTALGHEMVEDGRVDLAIVVFQQNAVDYPLNVQHLLHLGSAHLMAGDRSRAITAFERALAVDPSNPTAQGLLTETRAALRK